MEMKDEILFIFYSLSASEFDLVKIRDLLINLP